MPSLHTDPAIGVGCHDIFKSTKPGWGTECHDRYFCESYQPSASCRHWAFVLRPLFIDAVRTGVRKSDPGGGGRHECGPSHEAFRCNQSSANQMGPGQGFCLRPFFAAGTGLCASASLASCAVWPVPAASSTSMLILVGASPPAAVSPFSLATLSAVTARCRPTQTTSFRKCLLMACTASL